MSPLIFPVAGALAGTLVLVWVYAHLYRADRQRYLAVLGAAWLVDGVRHALGVLVALGAPAVLGHAALVAVPVFAGLLLAGAREFRLLRLPRVWPVLLVLGSVASLAGLAVGAPFAAVTAPAFVVSGLGVAAAGVELIRARDQSPRGRYVAGVASVLLGLHMLDYPLVRPLAQFAVPGYVLSGTLETVVAVGVLLMHLSRTQRALEEKSRLLKGIVDRSGSFVHVEDLHGRYVFVNQLFADQVGRVPHELLGATIRDLAAPEQVAIIEERHRKVLESGIPYRGEQALGDRTYEVNCFPLVDEHGATFALGVIYTDTTERRRFQERVHGAARLEALGTLARGVVHDLNNLLTVIAGHAAELSVRFPGDGDVAEIRGALHRGETLARGLLAFTSRQRLSPRVVDLDELVERARALVEQSVGERVSVQVHAAPGPCRTQVDPEQIEVVLANLALNAREAMVDGGRVEIETALVDVDAARAQRGGATPGLYAMLMFRDSGVGMSADTRAHMFDPFFTTKPAGLGAGLGLATVYGVVKQSGGFIEVDSAPGGGTGIRILFPHTDEHGRMSLRKLRRGVTPLDATASATILVVEDDPSVRKVVARTLRTAGYAVEQARDGEQGLERAATIGRRLALVITDVEMPRMGGVEMVEQLSLARPGTPVLFMSGFTDAIDRIARGHVERDFIQKPFEPQALLERVAVLLGAGVPESGIQGARSSVVR